MIEFKQIIGRGTRLFDGKDYFTVFDFVGAHELLNDPEWDGDPIAPEPKPERPEPEGDPDTPPDAPDTPDGDEEGGDDGGENGGKPLIRIKLADGKARNLRSLKFTSFWGPDGKPVTAREFLESLFGKLPDFFQNEDELRNIWSHPDTRQKLLSGLQEKGFDLTALRELQTLIDAEKSDLYDVLAYVAFSSPMELRTARAAQAKTRYPTSCTDPQKAFLDFILAQYVKEGFTELENEKLPPLIKGKYGDSIQDGIADLGGDINAVRGLFVKMQEWLYQPQSTL
jgi:type I restriction enzyme R subunit